MTRSLSPLAFAVLALMAVAPAVSRAAPPAPVAPPASAKREATAVPAVKRGDDVDVTSGAVTALSCALLARDEGKLEAVNSCPFEEAVKGIVVFDVAEKQIYALDRKQVRASALEKAFGGGSVDFNGTVQKLDKNGVATVGVEEITVMPKPKPGSSKACL